MVIGRTYIKIFLVFWLVTILTLLGYNIVLHYIGTGSDEHFNHNQSDAFSEPGGLLLKKIVSDAVNSDYPNVVKGVEALPPWATRYFYLLNQRGEDLLQRPVPPHVSEFSQSLLTQHPTQRMQYGEHDLFGRLIYLSDGAVLKLVVIDSPDNLLRWKLYVKNMWHVLLVSLILSGAA